MDLINQYKSELKVFYLDDGTLAGNINDVLEDYKMIQNAATTLGLTVNSSKCEIYQIRPKSKDCMEVYTQFCNASPD